MSGGCAGDQNVRGTRPSWLSEPREVVLGGLGDEVDVEQLESQRVDPVDQPLEGGLVGDHAAHGRDAVPTGHVVSLEGAGQRVAGYTLERQLIDELGHATPVGSTDTSRLAPGVVSC